MKKKAALLVNSITGNTKKIADALALELEKMEYEIICRYNRDCLSEIIDADLYLIGFWVRKGSLNDQSMDTIDLYENKKMLAFGSLGNYPDGEYGDLVRSNVSAYINKKNYCSEVFLSQGAIPIQRTEKRRQLPPDAPHYLDDEGYQRHLESRNHPNEEDLKLACQWLHQQLKKDGSL